MTLTLIRAAVVAPTVALRAGLRALLAADQQIVVAGEAPDLSGYDALAAGVDVLVILAEHPDSRLLRPLLDLPPGEPRPALLLLADEPPDFFPLPGAVSTGWGLLPLDTSQDELTTAVRAVGEGLVVAAPHLLERLFGPAHGLAARPLDTGPDGLDFDALTGREIEVLQLLAQGLANKQIAVALAISEHTVKFHISSIFSKLGAVNRTEAVRIGARRGLIVL